MNRYVKVFIICICLIIFCFTSIYVVRGTDIYLDSFDIYLDSFIHEIIYNNMVSAGMTSFMKIISMFGSGYIISIIALFIIIIVKDNRERLNIIMCLLLSSIFNNIVLKGIFRRNRPIYMMIKKDGYSFPSGHSMVSTVFYGYLIYLVYKYIDNKIIKNILICLLIIMILLICFSRIYLGVHYFSDVIGGISIGLLFLICFIHFNKKIIKKG